MKSWWTTQLSYDNSMVSTLAPTWTTHTYSYTNNGNLLIVGNKLDGWVELITSMTYGGQAMTKVIWYNETAFGIYMSMWYIYNPPKWANNVVVNLSSPQNNSHNTTISFSGAWTSPLNVSWTAANNSTSLTGSVTTSVDKCTNIAYYQTNAADGSWWSNTTIPAWMSGGYWFCYNTSPITPAWTASLILNSSASWNKDLLMGAFHP